MKYILYYKYLAFTLLLSVIICESKVSSIEKAYQKGVAAYTGERWSECIAQFEESLHLFKLYKSILLNCRLKCKSQPYEPLFNENIEDLKIYEKIFVTRNCLNKCKDKSFSNVNVDSELNEKMFLGMEARKPYEYLHICYYQMYALPKAASAAYTYLVTHPEDESMKNNIQYYVEQPEVDVNEIVDLESEEYKIMFNKGLNYYKQSNWAQTVGSMEKVLTDYIFSENDCRAECESQPDQETSSEIVITISNYIASLVHCQQHCQKKLSSLGYTSGVEFLADVLNYLQISYFHLDKFEEAAKAVATYLALMPSDEDMLVNKNIYSSLVDKNAFSTRSGIINYVKRDINEKKLLHLFHQSNNSIPEIKQ